MYSWWYWWELEARKVGCRAGKVLKTEYVGKALAYILIIVGASVADCVALSLSCATNTSRNSSTLLHGPS